eukprot:tig00020685_g12942.t1
MSESSSSSMVSGAGSSETALVATAKRRKSISVPPNVVVVGSCNVDVVAKAPRAPQLGETVTGEAFGTFVGGKGMNQAVACARMGGHVVMVGKIGNDAFGKQIMDEIGNEPELCLDYLTVDAKNGTGVAHIVVDAAGRNSIIVVPRANHALADEDVARAAPAFATARVLLLQLEVPMPVCIKAAKMARERGMLVVLNPAPAPPSKLDPELLALVDVLVPNESELQRLAKEPNDPSPIDPRPSVEACTKAARALLAKGVRRVLVTLGERGSLLLSEAGSGHVHAFRVPRVVDTTAAGDAFVGALAAELAALPLSADRFAALPQAMYVATAAAALSVTVNGALPSLPRREAALQLLADAGPEFMEDFVPRSM